MLMTAIPALYGLSHSLGRNWQFYLNQASEKKCNNIYMVHLYLDRTTPVSSMKTKTS